MTQDEVSTWVEYVKKNGPLNQSLRIEGAIARALSPFLKNAKPADLMIWPRKEEEDQPATLEGVFGMFKALAKPKKVIQ